jgi:HAD superfamily hydrolase (TIGR01509 family)
LVISAEIGLAKPDLAIYHWVINELGVKPAKAVFVDDFLHNIEAAWVVGMHGIHFRSPDQALGELRSLIELP